MGGEMLFEEDRKLTFYYDAAGKSEALSVIHGMLEGCVHETVSIYNEFLIDIYLMLDFPKSHHIAIDWDNTISADQEFFKQLIRNFQQAGYSPFICTLRAPDRENLREIIEVLEELTIPIYLTDGMPKRKFMKDLGVKVHLWIDDFYPGICGDSCKMLSRNNIE